MHQNRNHCITDFYFDTFSLHFLSAFIYFQLVHYYFTKPIKLATLEIEKRAETEGHKFLHHLNKLNIAASYFPPSINLTVSTISAPPTIISALPSSSAPTSSYE